MLNANKKVKAKDSITTKYIEFIPNFKNEKTQKFTNIILTLIAISLFGLFAINPTLSTIAKLKKELSDDEFVEHSLQEKINNLNILQKRYTDVQNDLPYTLDSIPKSPQVPILMAQIQSIAQSSNITLSNLQNLAVELFKENSVDKKYFSFSFAVTGTGTFENIATFLSRLVNMQRIINIDTLSIDKTSDKTGALRFSLQGLAYYKK